MDIIFLAALAIFIFVKLRNQLGKYDENKRRDAIKQFITEQANHKFSSNSKKKVFEDKSNDILSKVSSESQKKEIIDCFSKANTSINEFIEGANRAFVIIIESFSKGDLEKLKFLLSDNLFNKFQKIIKERDDKLVFNTTIVSIEESKILSCSTDINNFINIKVSFSSKQINFVTNSMGKVVEGSNSEIKKVENFWSFKKCLDSNSSKWIIFSTK